MGSFDFFVCIRERVHNLRSNYKGVDSLTIERRLWADWLKNSSVVKRYPAVVSVIPFLIGCIVWRMSQIRWEWWEREIRVWPLGVLGLLGLFWITRLFWKRFWIFLYYHPHFLLLLLLLGIIGYGYTEYSWNQTRFPFSGVVEEGVDLRMTGRITGMKGRGKTETWVIQPIAVRGEAESREWIRLKGRVQVLRPRVIQTVRNVRVGDRVVLQGTLKPFRHATNPGQFDYARYQRYLRFVGQMLEPQVYPQSRRPFDLMRWLDDGKSYAGKYFTRHLSEKHQPLVMSFLTGETDDLDEDELERIRILGLSHILAISGMNLGLIVFSLKKLMNWVHLPLRFHPMVLLTGIWIAVLFVGCQPSALRVGIYLTLAQWGEIGQRAHQPLNLLAATAWIILLYNPLTLFLLSFQLSFVVYLAILLLYQPLLHWLTQFIPSGHPWMTKFLQSLALSLAAFVGSTPIILFSFYTLPFQGIIMNLWAVPLSEVIIILIFSALFIGSLFPPIGLLLTWGLDHAVGLFMELVHRFAELCPWVWQPGRPRFIWFVLVYVLAGLLTRWDLGRKMPLLWVQRERNQIRPALILTGFLMAFLLFLPVSTPGLEWILLDVGQGDGMYLRLPQGQVMVVDGGGQPVGENYVGEKIVKPFLLSRGIRTIDLLCITHYDADHVRGLLPVLQELKVKAIWAPAGSDSDNARTIEQIARQRRIPMYHPVRGDVMQIGGTQIEVLNPRDGQYSMKENDRSLILRLAYGRLRILLTGDAGVKREEELLQEEYALGAEILKVGHHGSQYSTSEPFLKEVAPRFALISVGPNRYGHPTEETLDRLEQQGCTVLRTDQVGAIRLVTDGDLVRIVTFNRIRQSFS